MPTKFKMSLNATKGREGFPGLLFFYGLCSEVVVQAR